MGGVGVATQVWGGWGGRGLNAGQEGALTAQQFLGRPPAAEPQHGRQQPPGPPQQRQGRGHRSGPRPFPAHFDDDDFRFPSPPPRRPFPAGKRKGRGQGGVVGGAPGSPANRGAGIWGNPG